jgi:hypothetical protein
MVGSFEERAGRGNIFSMRRTAARCMINVIAIDVLMLVMTDTTTPYDQAVSECVTRYKVGSLTAGNRAINTMDIVDATLRALRK